MNRGVFPRITALLLSASLIILGLYIYFESCSPDNMARNSDGCLRFFGFSKIHYTCVDEMHSQGKDCFAFGQHYYCLRGFDPQSFERLKLHLRDKGANFTDSIATFRLQRDNINGAFRLFLYDATYQARVSFAEIED